MALSDSKTGINGWLCPQSSHKLVIKISRPMNMERVAIVYVTDTQKEQLGFNF